MRTEALLLFGAAAAVLFGVVVRDEGARRPGYDRPTTPGGELELGPEEVRPDPRGCATVGVAAEELGSLVHDREDCADD